LALLPRTSDARKRPRFEPTDLELEKEGTTETDLQVGLLRNDSHWRFVVPDVEFDLGLSPNVELDIDGAYAIEGPDDGRFTFDHPAPENVWIAAKLGLYDSRDDGDNGAWAVGAQLGPKLPVANNAHGIGYEALLLVGRAWGENHLVLNAGGLIDPGPHISSDRPIGVQGGLDLDLQLGSSKFSVTGELAGVHFFSADSDQLNGTGGVKWSPSDDLELSVVGLVGLAGGDVAGVLLGVSPKLALWK